MKLVGSSCSGRSYNKAGRNKAGVTTNFVVTPLRRSLLERPTLSNAASMFLIFPWSGFVHPHKMFVGPSPPPRFCPCLGFVRGLDLFVQ